MIESTGFSGLWSGELQSTVINDQNVGAEIGRRASEEALAELTEEEQHSLSEVVSVVGNALKQDPSFRSQVEKSVEIALQKVFDSKPSRDSGS
jgi:hypothetical protein